VPYSWLVVNGEPVVVEKVDDYTVKFKFAGPNGLFLLRAATGSGLTFTTQPKHYLSQFHPNYADVEELDKMIEDAGFETWDQLYWDKADAWTNPEKPVLHAWVAVQPYSGTNVNVIFERNPYYWKVDAEGNQLPYIDTVALDVGDDVDTLTLRALNGEIDMQARHIATLENKAVFYENREAGNYDFFTIVPAGNNAIAISLNWTYDDPVLREVFRNKDFRIGLSHAIDRQEIIDTVLLGQGIPYQIAPRPESEFYDEEFATQYTEYNVELANEYLDKAFPEKDADGFRLGPDGERISFVFEVMAIQQSWLDMMEMIKGYWADVGVDVQIKAIDRSILTEHKDNNLHQATVWGGEGGLGGDLWLDPYWYFPMYFGSNYAVTWWWYYVGDTRLPEGEMPSEAALRQMELYDMIKGTADAEEQAEYMRELLQIAKEEFYVMGVALPGDGYGIVKNNFHNVPESMPGSWQYVNPGPTNTCQYYIDPQ
jgi:peptide/nickel transport system substrate-binding protein